MFDDSVDFGFEYGLYEESNGLVVEDVVVIVAEPKGELLNMVSIGA